MSPPSRTLGPHFSCTPDLTDTRGRGYHDSRKRTDATPSSLWHSRAGAWLLPVSLLGCIAPTAETELLERVQKERACTADKLKVTYLGASAYRVEGCGPPETFICVSYQGWVCTKEGAQSSKRVLETVTTLTARALAEVPPPPPPVQVIEPPVFIPYIPPPPPPPTF